MKHVAHVKRYIDDGAGFFTGSRRQFESWISSVNHALKVPCLAIDEFTFEELGICVPFLDIRFCIDMDGSLFTDLHIKATDSRSYLYFGSSHPNHVYSGIVYSQCSRLRRIIISNDILKSRLAELCDSFISCGYPSSMVRRICDKVLNVNRDLNVLIKKKPVDNHPSDTCVHNVRIVSTYGTDELLVNCVKNAIPHLQNTASFKTKQVKFSFTKKTAPSIGSKLSVLKKMSLGIQKGGTVKCSTGKTKCLCCDVISSSPQSHVTVNGQKVQLPSGNCKSKNIIYLCQCNLCADKCYVGRTVQPLHKRVCGHRQGLTNVVSEGLNYVNSPDISSDDTLCLGMHLFNEHGITTNFNDHFTFHVLEHVSPLQMEKIEHLWIHKLNTLFPNGLNRSNPFGLPILDCSSVT